MDDKIALQFEYKLDTYAYTLNYAIFEEKFAKSWILHTKATIFYSNIISLHKTKSGTRPILLWAKSSGVNGAYVLQIFRVTVL